MSLKIMFSIFCMSQIACFRLEFFVDCSANATPEFEGRGGQALADSLSATLQRAYNTFDTTSLCLLKGDQ